jgi:hypothetical protein
MISGLPSKKIFFLIVACVVGVGAIGFAVYATKNGLKNGFGDSLFANSSNKNNTGSLESVENSLKTRSGLDDDADGLLNWEESLWGTSLANPDSDSDGTNDGEEVQTNRNPTKPGPGDTLQTTSYGSENTGVSEGSGGANTELSNTETAKIGRDLFINYIQAKQSGAELNDSTTQKIVEEAITQKIKGVEVKTYSLSDLQTNSDGDFKAYGNKLGQTLTIGASQNPVSEIEIVQKALATEDPTEIKKLDPIIAGYTKILNELVAISVPREVAGQHLNLLNSVSAMLSDIKNLRVVFEDPIVGLIGISSYYKNVESVRSALSELRVAFSTRGVSFVRGEYGYVFMQTI